MSWRCELCKNVNRKVHGVLQLQTAANPRHQEEEKKDQKFVQNVTCIFTSGYFKTSYAACFLYHFEPKYVRITWKSCHPTVWYVLISNFKSPLDSEIFKKKLLLVIISSNSDKKYLLYPLYLVILMFIRYARGSLNIVKIRTLHVIYNYWLQWGWYDDLSTRKSDNPEAGGRSRSSRWILLLRDDKSLCQPKLKSITVLLFWMHVFGFVFVCVFFFFVFFLFFCLFVVVVVFFCVWLFTLNLYFHFCNKQY